ncbi:hypothetical protein [Pseudomonas sp. SCA2728.1_7]|uniref:hypothetical protein n=1 Tax=Pseudomonas sp. SCA2728.1_7 TaxID=2825975 RepID=UPI001BAF8CB3|nr:hypothetical protein [Pseudomonas sp. SCA2728.1_7]QUE91091.1 hypothetical protein KBP52_01165 [Pseudomonas sp. SCA2728.1_7]
MRSVKITIAGSYWDSQIYSGELLLFDNDGGLHRIDWSSFVDKIASNNNDIQTAVRVAFSDSDLFYNPKVVKILRDPDLEMPIKAQLSKLSTLELQESKESWKEIWATEETPFFFLPTDTEIYYNNIFAGGDEGLYSAPRQGRPIGRFASNFKAKRHHDATVLQVKASDSYTAIATASGAEGLFDFSLLKSSEGTLSKARLIAERPCNACDWAFQSVLGWSANSAFMASFREEKEPNSKKIIRVIDRVIDQGEMFENSGEQSSFAWGAREKLYKLTEGRIEVQHYRASEKKSKNKFNKKFNSIGSLSFKSPSSVVIASGTASFGTVLEFCDRILVVRSDGLEEEFLEEPVHWRIFPRSEHYSNQLHIIYEDRLVILSFVHDYFVDQSSKLFGFSKGKNEYTEYDLD